MISGRPPTTSPSVPRPVRTGSARPASLKRRLAQAEATITALLADKVDAVLDHTSTSAVMLRSAQLELRVLNERLERSEAYFRSLIENVTDLISVLEADGTIRYISPSLRRLVGFDPSEQIGHKAFDLVHPDDAPRVHAFMVDAVARGVSGAIVSYRHKHEDGSWRQFESTGLNMLADPAVRGIVVTSRDVTERLETERRYRSLFENMVQAFAHCRMLYEDGTPTDFVYLEVNREFELQTGLRDVVGKRVSDVIRGFRTDSADLLALFGRVASGGPPEQLEVYVSGLERWFAVSTYAPTPLHFIAVFKDITERRALEAQYQQAQKMEAVGRLAGGVAHDFNNLLTVILGFCDLLLADHDPDDPDQADIGQIQKAATRGAGLTRQLLAFSRKQIIEPTLLDLNLLVSDMRPMLGRLIGEDVKVEVALAPEPASVKADRGQIEQVVMNLAVNARDAMPKGGTLTIETANVELDEYYAKTHLAVEPGAYVRLTATDTGIGMAPEVQSRLFEPFFTTKEVGKGTGLGMATVYGIVTAGGGTIDVHSEVGNGTSFKLYFPAAHAAEGVAVAPTPVVGRQAGGQTVLLVEDAEGVRELTTRLLQRLGYTVLVAANADEAIQLFHQHPSIDLLLTDVVMPGASGPELALGLVEERPALKVIYMSGYTEAAIVHHGVLKPGIALVHKPFTSETLGAKIREVCER